MAELILTVLFKSFLTKAEMLRGQSPQWSFKKNRLCFSQFYVTATKMPDRNSFMEEQYVWVHSFRGFNSDDEGQGSAEYFPSPGATRTRKGDTGALPVFFLFLLFCSDPHLKEVAPTLRVDLLPSANSPWECPQPFSIQTCLTMASLSSVLKHSIMEGGRQLMRFRKLSSYKIHEVIKKKIICGEKRLSSRDCLQVEQRFPQTQLL